MKNKLDFSIIITVGAITAAVLFLISASNDEQPLPSPFDYELIEYDDLVSRNAKIGLYAIPNPLEKELCFSISSENITSSSSPSLEFLSSHIEETSHIREDIQFEDAPPEFYTRFDTPINTSLALEMILAYDFESTIIETENNIVKIPDKLYYFDCPFEYKNEQMMLRVMFESHFWENVPVYVNATRNNMGIPALTNENIVIFDGGLNSTVHFYNNLEKEITLRSTDPINYLRDKDDRYFNSEEPDRTFENKFAKITNENTITIPPGKIFSYHFASWHNPYSGPLNYTISPSNLKGTITLMPYYDCAPSIDIFLPYSKYHKVPEEPLYLPDGYKYECGFYHYPEAPTYYYASNNQSDESKENLGHGISPKFLGAGGLAIRLVDLKSYGYPYPQQESDKFTVLTEKFSSDSMTAYLHGQPTIFEKANYGDKFGRITVYLDYDTWYVVEGGLPFSELLKITESIAFEKGGNYLSIPESFENEFKDKSLFIELIDFKEVYHPGQLVSFEVFAQGHVPVPDNFDVIITDSDGNTVWQNPSSVDFGGPEIGYVDYTWSTEYDFQSPQIYEVGHYNVKASLHDVSVEHKFQVREEPQFSLLHDMISENSFDKTLLSSFDDDCSRKNNIAEFIADSSISEIKNRFKENNALLDVIFEKQEISIDDEKRTRNYVVPEQILECIEQIKVDNDKLEKKLEEDGNSIEFDLELLLRESKVLYHGHDYQKSIDTAEFILENLSERNTDAMILKGKSLVRLDKYEKAVSTFEDAVKINPDSAEGWFRLGHALSSTDQHEMALERYDHSIKVDPNYADAYIGKAFTLMTLERFDEALENAEKAIAIYPDRPVYRQIYQTVFDISESMSTN